MTQIATSTCYSCGHSWPTGTDGHHNCAIQLKSKINELREALKEAFGEHPVVCDDVIFVSMHKYNDIVKVMNEIPFGD